MKCNKRVSEPFGVFLVSSDLIYTFVGKKNNNLMIAFL